MQSYEYKVVPAPTKGTKAKGVKTPEARFAHMLQELMNEMGAEGWEYQRAETLPSEERKGLTGSATNWRHLLIFRRPLAAAVTLAPTPVAAPVESAQPVETYEEAAPQPAPDPAEKPAEFVSAPRPVEPPAPRPVPAPTVARPAMAPPPPARETWNADQADAPKPAPSINPFAAPRKNPENSDV